MNESLVKKILAEERGLPHFNQNQVAFDLSEQALALLEQQGDLYDEAAIVLITVFGFLKDEKITDEEIEIFRKVIHLFNFDGVLNSFAKIQLINLLKNIAANYFTQKKYGNAEKSYETALVIAADYPIEQVKIYLKIWEINIENRDYNRVIVILKLAEAIILSHEIPEKIQIECFKILVTITFSKEIIRIFLNIQRKSLS
jgi:tetratricopeptide (TPR) repeat protein